MKIRPVEVADAQALLDIYAPYIEETAITFETEVPSIDDFGQRIETIRSSYPYLVVEVEGEILGYAYASAYYGRAAYQCTAELSIYLKQTLTAKGLGTALYQALEKSLQEQGIRQVLSCIAIPNEASLNFHRKQGFEQVGHFPKVGYKFDQWWDIIWMQKSI